MAQCKWCESEFAPKTDRQIYCSEECCDKAGNARYVKQYIEKHGELTVRPCAYCGTEFKPKRRDSRYCSKLCNSRYLRENPNDDYVSDPETWAVTTPYGAHSFDWWVKCSLEGGGAVSHV